MIRRVAISEVRQTSSRPRRLMLNRMKRQSFINRKMSLPEGKELKTSLSEQSKQTKILASTKCSEYEPINYCEPLFP